MADMRPAGRPNAHTVALSDDASSRPRVIVHVSDTHSQLYREVPVGDILVHSGDFSNRGTDEETAEFNRWWRHQPHPFKVLVCGNHDFGFDKLSVSEVHRRVFAGVSGECHVLLDSAATVDGLRFYGSPWNNSRGQAFGTDANGRAEKWQRIPSETDVLVTHMPPYAILDLAWTRKAENDGPCETCAGATHQGHRHWGCPALRATVEALRVPLHLFGHVHDVNGIEALGPTVFSNAAMDIDPRPSVITVVGVGAPAAPAPAAAANDPAQQQHLQPSASEAAMLAALGVPGAVTLADADAWAGNRAPVLDIDKHDRSLQTVLLWRQLGGAPAQQRWAVRVVAPPPEEGSDAASTLSPRALVGILESALPVDGAGRERRLLSSARRDRPTVAVIPVSAPPSALPESVLWRITLVAPPTSSMRRYRCATIETLAEPRRKLAGVLSGGADHTLVLVDAGDDGDQQSRVAVWVLPV